MSVVYVYMWSVHVWYYVISYYVCLYDICACMGCIAGTCLVSSRYGIVCGSAMYGLCGMCDMCCTHYGICFYGIFGIVYMWNMHILRYVLLWYICMCCMVLGVLFVCAYV